MDFCSQCGHGTAPTARFCSNCGSALVAPEVAEALPEGSVRITPEERRVRVGELAHLRDDPAGLEREITRSVIVAADSDAGRAAGKSFQAAARPTADTWVPLDSAWALFPYPGPPLMSRGIGSMRRRMGAIGVLAGRREQEIISFVGPPNVRVGNLLTWSEASWSDAYAITLAFDRYRVCSGVISESTH